MPGIEVFASDSLPPMTASTEPIVATYFGNEVTANKEMKIENR
ncbi:hypothetical protein [Halobacillus faecis]